MGPGFSHVGRAPLGVDCLVRREVAVGLLRGGDQRDDAVENRSSWGSGWVCSEYACALDQFVDVGVVKRHLAFVRARAACRRPLEVSDAALLLALLEPEGMVTVRLVSIRDVQKRVDEPNLRERHGGDGVVAGAAGGNRHHEARADGCECAGAQNQSGHGDECNAANRLSRGVSPRSSSRRSSDGASTSPIVRFGRIFCDHAVRMISPDYFRIFGIPLREGRSFTTADRDDASPVAIINATFARQYFAGRSPVGRRIRLDDGEKAPREWKSSAWSAT